MQPAPIPRVTLVTSGLGTGLGGIGVVTQSIVAGLEWDHEVLLWRNRTRFSRPARRLLLLGQAAMGAMWQRPDFVFYEHVHLAAMHGSLPALRKIPYGVFLHGREVWEPLGRKRRQALERASILVANSANTVSMARQANPWLPQVQVAWLGVRNPVVVCDAGAKPPVALMVGRLAPGERGKGHDEVLTAWPVIRATMPRARLIIVGDGQDRLRLEQRVRQEHISGVEFVPRAGDRERDSFYASARLLLFPSRQEGFGLAGVEAAAAGVPVLGLAGTVMEELFPAGDGVALVPDTQPLTLARAAISILQGANLASAMGQAARRRVLSALREDQFVERFRAILAPALRRAREPSASGFSAPA